MAITLSKIQYVQLLIEMEMYLRYIIHVLPLEKCKP